MSGESQALLAAQGLEFELGTLGFNLTRDPDNAAVFADFSIGTVRFDPLAGWIADQAFLEFRDAASGEVRASYRAKVRWVTPTVENLVSNIIDRVKTDTRE